MSIRRYESIEALRFVTSVSIDEAAAEVEKAIQDRVRITEPGKEKILERIPSYMREHKYSVEVDEEKLVFELFGIVRLAVKFRRSSEASYPLRGRVGAVAFRKALG